MAKKDTENDKNAKPKRKLGWRMKLMLFIFVVGAIILLKQSCILLLIGMLPAIVAMIVDDTATLAWFKTVFCFNLSGILPFIADLYQQGNSLSSMQQLVSSFDMWLVVYCAAGAGWLTVWLCGKVSHWLVRLYTQGRIDNHQRKIEKIDKEWSISPVASANNAAT